MFQTFDNTSDPSLGAARVKRLRGVLHNNQLDGVIIPRSDEHQGEYVPTSAERLSWLSGFTGSAGCAVVLMQSAAIFVDGRYTLQVREQVDTAIFTQQDLLATPPAKWLAANIGAGARIAFDPWLHTINNARTLATEITGAEGELIAVDENLVDAIWHHRPAPPIEPVRIHPIEYAGKQATEKLAELATKIVEKGAENCLLTDPSSIAWCFNIRGNDVAHTPLPLSFAIIKGTGRPLLFIDRRKLDIETSAYLTQLADIHPPAALEDEFAAIARTGNSIMLDPDLAADKFTRIVAKNDGRTIEAMDPARLPRAIKNEAEITGTRSAHLRDGAAFAEFLCWFDRQSPGCIDEIGVTKKLEACRVREGERFQIPLRDISFDTISGSGPNGAIVHYRVNTATNRVLGEGELYLVDSGGQYEDGTTDITRTIAIGEPTDEMRRNNTLVLKGHIAIALARFPKGTRGVDIDPFARSALWQNGLDYAHGTGHGVGSYLAVHEGPQNISRRGMQELHPGMIISNEPGYYKQGQYGIRIENLVLVRGPEEIEGGDIAMLGFETLTLAPFDHSLIDPQLLDDKELHWLNAYHGHVRRQLMPLVSDGTGRWLQQACEPIARILPPASA